MTQLFLVSYYCSVLINFCNNFELSVWCNVLLMKVAHIVLGRPWPFDEMIQYDVYEKIHTLVHNGHKKKSSFKEGNSTT